MEVGKVIPYGKNVKVGDKVYLIVLDNHCKRHYPDRVQLTVVSLYPAERDCGFEAATSIGDSFIVGDNDWEEGNIIVCAWPEEQEQQEKPAEEYTGGSVSYYSVDIKRPTSGGPGYTAECNDIIEALGMNYAEGNAFKAIWRRAAAQMGKVKKGYTDGLYDAEKVVFFGQRMVAQEQAKREESNV